MKGKQRNEEEALEFIQPIIPLLETGLSLSQACEYAGISRKIVTSYIDRWESVGTIVTTAKMKLLASSLNTLSEHAKNDPKIALEVAKRRDKKRWSDRQEIDQHNTGDLTIKVVKYGDSSTV